MAENIKYCPLCGETLNLSPGFSTIALPVHLDGTPVGHETEYLDSLYQFCPACGFVTTDIDVGVPEERITYGAYCRFDDFVNRSAFLQPETYPLLLFDMTYYVQGRKPAELGDADANSRNALYGSNASEMMANEEAIRETMRHAKDDNGLSKRQMAKYQKVQNYYVFLAGFSCDCLNGNRNFRYQMREFQMAATTPPIPEYMNACRRNGVNISSPDASLFAEFPRLVERLQNTRRECQKELNASRTGHRADRDFEER